MLFNSLEFVLFFPIVTVGYFAIAGRHRWLWLVLASALFYMVFVPHYILILMAVIGIVNPSSSNTTTNRRPQNFMRARP